MELRDLTWLVGGPQGGGINASAETLTKACTRAGYRVIANIEYHSNIMGEHSFYRVRISDEDRHLDFRACARARVVGRGDTLRRRAREVPRLPGALSELVSRWRRGLRFRHQDRQGIGPPQVTSLLCRFLIRDPGRDALRVRTLWSGRPHARHGEHHCHRRFPGAYGLSA